MKLFTIIFSVFTAMVPAAYAADCTVSPLTETNFSTCLSQAADGDTITLASGTVSFTSRKEIRAAITIVGAGIDQTIVNDNSGSAGGMWDVQVDADGVVRISGMTINATGAPTQAKHAVYIRAPSGDASDYELFRVDQIKFVGPRTVISGGNHINVSQAYGLIDNCEFDSSAEGVFISGSTGEWCNQTRLGTTDFVVIEDCTFNYDQNNGGDAFDSAGNARLVFRYNTVYNDNIEMHGCDSFAYGARAWEIYENDFVATTGATAVGGGIIFRPRGGTGVVYDNRITAQLGRDVSSAPVRLNTFRISTGCGSCSTCRAPSTFCPTSEGGEGYPCYDQIGRGVGTGSDCSTNQTLEPVRIWGNSCSGAGTCPSAGGWVLSQNQAYIQSSRDYYYSDDTSTALSYRPLDYPHYLRNAGAASSETSSCFLNR